MAKGEPETPAAPVSVAHETDHGDTAPETEPGTFSVIAVGDVMMDKHARHHIHEHGIEYPFAGVEQELSAHDIAFANLEAPISARGAEQKKWKKFHFRVHPDHARALTLSGIDVVSLANNHMMDFGEEALLDTVRALDGWGIRHAGAGGNVEAARAPVRMDVKGTEVIFLSYCAFQPSFMHALDERPGVAPADEEAIIEDVKTFKTPENVVLVSLHWGVQHTDRATAGQRALARRILDAGADSILGHHPHRPQDVEVYHGKIIAYSLGNFLFGYYNPIYRNNIALVLEFRGNHLTGTRILPVDGRNGRIRFQPRFMKGGGARKVLTHVMGLSAGNGTQMRIEGDEAILDLTASP